MNATATETDPGGVRRKWVIFAALLVVLVAGSALIAVAGGDGGDRPITVEQFTLPDGATEVLITVSDEQNDPSTTGGKDRVVVVCRDAGNRPVLQSSQPWPLQRDGDPPLPHAHLPASAAELRSIAGCRIDGTEPLLEGRLGLSR